MNGTKHELTVKETIFGMVGLDHGSAHNPSLRRVNLTHLIPAMFRLRFHLA